MSFNLASFNQGGFNIGGENGIFDIGAEIYLTFQAIIGTAVEINAGAIINERVTTAITGEKALLIPHVEITEKVNDYISGSTTTINLLVILSETVTIDEIHIHADIAPETVLASSFDCDVLGSGICDVAGTSATMFVFDSVLGSDFVVAADAYEVFTSAVSVDSLDMRTCLIGTNIDRLVLHPGERLVVDANNYNVLINNENAIWLQSGEWIDELTRDTIDISIMAASGVENLSATVLYTERYL